MSIAILNSLFRPKTTFTLTLTLAFSENRATSGFGTRLIAKHLECRHRGVRIFCCSAPVFRRFPRETAQDNLRQRRNTAHSKRFARFGCGFAMLRSALL